MLYALKILSPLPHSVLYGISRVFYFFIYRIVGYRKKVVREHLSFAFPDKKENELRELEKKFYWHFSDLFVEVLMLQRIPREEISNRVRFTEQATKLLNELPQKYQYIIAVLGHCGNWEWVNAGYAAQFSTPLLGVYHPLTNKKFDAWMQNLRSRFGTIPVPMNGLLRYIRQHPDGKFIIGLIADQSAPPEHSYCLPFLNKKTTVFKGPEKLAKKFNAPVVYFPVIKISKGMYQVDAILITEKPINENEQSITEKHVKALENNIRQQPECWLWTHKRWKHQCN
ncbi:MAG: lysophospholipid acyltransferase family protein [Bacteroidia bacterium]|nr:lysophospholipid acyltransferase family protein [Bacteroidia bacterium]